MNDAATREPLTPITLYTIGFTGKSAREFFETLQNAGVKRLVDVRLNNVSQLAGFTKKRDLEYFLRAIADIDYLHTPVLAPTKEILDDYKKKRIGWDEYEQRFRQLLEDRQPAQELRREDLDRACLLCSEPTAEQCHRRLVAEFLKDHWAGMEIVHL